MRPLGIKLLENWMISWLEIFELKFELSFSFELSIVYVLFSSICRTKNSSITCIKYLNVHHLRISTSILGYLGWMACIWLVFDREHQFDQGF